MFADGFVDASTAPPLLADMLAKQLDRLEADRQISFLSSILKVVGQWHPGVWRE